MKTLPAVDRAAEVGLTVECVTEVIDALIVELASLKSTCCQDESSRGEVMLDSVLAHLVVANSLLVQIGAMEVPKPEAQVIGAALATQAFRVADASEETDISAFGPNMIDGTLH